MAKLQRVEGEVKLKCDADKFFDVWCQKPYLVAKMCPIKFPKIELLEGDCWHKVGAVTTWNYVLDSGNGKHSLVKLRVEELDAETRFARYSHLDGLIMEKYFTSFKSKIQVVAYSNGKGCIVKWNFEYEKKSDDAAPEPKMYIDFLIGAAKDVDACISCT